MNELALFAGAGGGILGGKLLGWRTVCAVEWERYPASVLCARQNDGLLDPFPIWDDVQTFDGKPWRGIVEVVSGGFPCQDISAAGKGAGIDGERSGMWREMARIICEVRPLFTFIENSPMLTIRGLDRVLSDLAQMGFDARWCVLGANAVGAPHKRERIWILAADSDRIGWDEWGCYRQERHFLRDLDRDAKESQSKRDGWKRGFSKVGEDVANTQMLGLTSCDQPTPKRRGNMAEQFGRSDYEFGSPKYWETEPPVGRVVNGMAGRVDRLIATGNGQVPLCAATAWHLLTQDL